MLKELHTPRLYVGGVDLQKQSSSSDIMKSEMFDRSPWRYRSANAVFRILYPRSDRVNPRKIEHDQQLSAKQRNVKSATPGHWLCQRSVMMTGYHQHPVMFHVPMA